MTLQYDIPIQELNVGTFYTSDSSSERLLNPEYPVGQLSLQGGASGDHLRCVNHPTIAGRKALEFLVQKSPNSVQRSGTHKGRTEISSSYNLGPSADYYVGYRIMFPDNFPMGAWGLIFTQAGNLFRSGHPIVTFGIKGRDEDFNVLPIGQERVYFEGGYDMPLVRNRWYAIEYRVKMGLTASTGKVQVWIDGVMRVDSNQQTSDREDPTRETKSQQGKEYLYKTGLYAHEWNTQKGQDNPPRMYRYFIDHMKMGTTRAEVAYTPTTAPVAPSVSLTAPANNSKLTIGQTVALKASATTASGTITKVEFSGYSDFRTLLGADTTASSNVFEIAYSFQSAGTKTIYAKAHGSNGGITISSPFTYTVSAVVDAPVVEIIAPAEGSTIDSNQIGVMKAGAMTGAGTITKVEFYYAGTDQLIGTDTTPVDNVFEATRAFNPGDKEIYAIAHGSNGVTTRSEAVTFVVKDLAPPEVALTAPTNGEVLTTGQPYIIKATASAPSGIAKVEIVDPRTDDLLGEATLNAGVYELPFTFNVVDSAKELMAIAYGTNGIVSQGPIVVFAASGAAPTVSLTQPVPTTKISFGVPQILKATASTTNGSITRVEFVDTTNNIILGESSTLTNGSFEITYTFETLGIRNLVAKAYGSNGNSTSSTTVNVEVVHRPVVAWVAPASGTVVATNTNIVFKATASLVGGTISKVDFFKVASPSDELLDTDTTATGNEFEITKQFTTEGTFRAYAKAVGSNNRITFTPIVDYIVRAADTTPPAVTIQPPRFLVGQLTQLVAIASDNVGIQKVEFFGSNADGTILYSVLASATAAPYQGSYAFQTVGTKYVVAKATDNSGNVTQSGPVSFQVY